MALIKGSEYLSVPLLFLIFSHSRVIADLHTWTDTYYSLLQHSVSFHSNVVGNYNTLLRASQSFPQIVSAFFINLFEVPCYKLQITSGVSRRRAQASLCKFTPLPQSCQAV